jgi:hypothetical protein
MMVALGVLKESWLIPRRAGEAASEQACGRGDDQVLVVGV